MENARKYIDLIYEIGDKYNFIEHDQFEKSMTLEYEGDFEYITTETDDDYDEKSKIIYKKEIEPIVKEFLNEFFKIDGVKTVFKGTWWNWIEDYPIIEIPFTEEYIKHKEGED